MHSHRHYGVACVSDLQDVQVCSWPNAVHLFSMDSFTSLGTLIAYPESAGRCNMIAGIVILPTAVWLCLSGLGKLLAVPTAGSQSAPYELLVTIHICSPERMVINMCSELLVITRCLGPGDSRIWLRHLITRCTCSMRTAVYIESNHSRCSQISQE